MGALVLENTIHAVCSCFWFSIFCSSVLTLKPQYTDDAGSSREELEGGQACCTLFVLSPPSYSFPPSLLFPTLTQKALLCHSGQHCAPTESWSPLDALLLDKPGNHLWSLKHLLLFWVSHQVVSKYLDMKFACCREPSQNSSGAWWEVSFLGRC